MRTLALLLFALVGCAATYRAPSTPPTRFFRPFQGERVATSEAAKPQRLTADDCDCGTTLGLPYIKDKRTQTIAPSIHGSYLPGDANQSISFDCVSKGTLERALFEKVVRQVGQ